MTSLRKEQEQIILGGWLFGKHVDDIDRIDEQDFKEYPGVAAAIKEHGADVMRVSKTSGVSLSELAKMTGAYTETFYQSAVLEINERKQREYLMRVADSDTPLSEIKQVLDTYKDIDCIRLPEPAQDWLADYWKELDERPGRKIVNTWMRSLDNILCGIRRKELTSIGARPAVGKSAFALQIALTVARQGEKVMYFPLEMSTMQTVERMFLRNIDIPIWKLRKGEVDWEKINVQSEKIYDLEKSGNFLIFEAVNDINVIRELVKTHKPYMVVIDQLEQMRCATERFKDKRERFSYMTNNLKRLSMVENCHIMLACQINRGAERSEPTMANLKESGSIEEDSDNVLLLHRIPLEDMETDGWTEDIRPMLVIVAKQRSGGTGTVKCKFIANRFTFKEII